MSSIQEILASILQAVYGKDVRQAIHDGVEMAYNKADNAETSAAAAAEAASGSQNSAAASAQAAANSASSASDSADLAEQYKNEAFHTTPAGYEAFVGEVNSSLEKNGYGAHGIKNLVEQVWYYTQTQQYKTIAEATYYVENGKTYTISFDTPNTGVQCYIQGDSVSGLQTTSAFYLDGTRKTITAICVATGQHTKEPFIAIRSNTGVASGMLSNLQIEEGSTATEYNPFAQSNVALTERLKQYSAYTQAENNSISNSGTFQDLCTLAITEGIGLYIVHVTMNYVNVLPERMLLDVYNSNDQLQETVISYYTDAPVDVIIPIVITSQDAPYFLLKGKWKSDSTGCKATIRYRKILGYN